MVGGLAAGAAEHDGAGLFLGGLQEVVEGLIGAVLGNDEGVRGGHEQHDGLDLVGGVAGLLALQGLEDDVGQVETGGVVAVGLVADEFLPAHGTAAAHEIGDDHALAQSFFEQGLLSAGEDVGFTACIEGDHVCDGRTGEICGRGGGDEERHRGEGEQKLFDQHDSLLKRFRLSATSMNMPCTSKREQEICRYYELE